MAEKGDIVMYVFEPSRRRLLTVQGSDHRYWLDADLKYCSCRGFYFNRLQGRDGCYHITAAKGARSHRSQSLDDSEYAGFAAGITSAL